MLECNKLLTPSFSDRGLCGRDLCLVSFSGGVLLSWLSFFPTCCLLGFFHPVISDIHLHYDTKIYDHDFKARLQLEIAMGSYMEISTQVIFGTWKFPYRQTAIGWISRNFTAHVSQMLTSGKTSVSADLNVLSGVGILEVVRPVSA